MIAYRSLVRPLLFRTDAEWIHDQSIRWAERASGSDFISHALSNMYGGARDPRLAVEVQGLRFDTPLGLAAGYDKSARAVPLLASLGFSHIEVGSVSAEPSKGNPKPRLFRIPEDRAIVVWYGVPNDGAQRVAARLTGRHVPVPVGVNVVNTNHGPEAPEESEDAIIDDYLRTVRTLQDTSDYLCLNLSCPNTRDGQGFFQKPQRLRHLLDGLRQVGIVKPLFLKVAPFSSSADIEAFLDAAAPARFVSGFSTNLPSGRPEGLRTPKSQLDSMRGAVSGKPSETRANATLTELYRRMDRKRHVLIGSGGIFTAEDAYRKIRLGASLVQLFTSLIYEGPAVVRRIHEGLPALLERDGFRCVSDAVGVDVSS